MLITISTTHAPARDLGFLLHKHPDRVQEISFGFGRALVMYPEASDERCTAALLLDIDPVRLSRGTGRRDSGSLEPYVNDRPYVCASHMAVAMGKAFSTAMTGKCKGHEELAASEIPLEVGIHVAAVRGNDELVAELFEPLGWTVAGIERHELDEKFPDWGESPYCTIQLTGTLRLADALRHLVVLLPVLDAGKHYYVDQDEVDKLMRRGEGWLDEHPRQKFIVDRYLEKRRHLTRDAFERLVTDAEEVEEEAEKAEAEEERIERVLSLNEQRLNTVLAALRASGAASVVDLGCGEGKLLRLLLKERAFSRITGMDVSWRVLESAARRLRLDEMPRMQRERIELLHGSLMYRDARLSGHDAAACVEVIEHLDEPRLAAFERVVFEHAQPRTVIVTTPNREYNAMWESLPAGEMRHRDHRFEWSREEFQRWAAGIAERFDYEVRFEPVGPVDETHGSPTQMGVFTR